MTDDDTEPFEPKETCPYCGEPCAQTITVEYDAMVDGPGYLMIEERCRSCAEYAP